MEAVCARAELRSRDGQNRTFSVRTGTSLSALSAAISELNRKASQLLTELVDSVRARGDEEKDKEGEEDEDGEEEDGLTSDLQPEPKRSKSS